MHAHNVFGKCYSEDFYAAISSGAGTVNPGARFDRRRAIAEKAEEGKIACPDSEAILCRAPAGERFARVCTAPLRRFASRERTLPHNFGTLPLPLMCRNDKLVILFILAKD